MRVDNLHEDSADFSEAEAEGATKVTAVSEMIAYLRDKSCQACGNGNAVFPATHEQRRRAGVMYCRMRLACSELHESSIVFRVADLQQAVE